MSALYEITAVFLDGELPTDGSEPLIPETQNLAIAQWADEDIYINAFGQDGAAFAISGGAFVMSVKETPASTALVISREATITVSAGGSRCAYVPIGSNDVGITPKGYCYSLVFIDSAGKIWAPVLLSTFAVTPNDYTPGDDVTVPSSQQPLAQGPIGPTGPEGPAGTASISLFRYTVSQPDDGDDFMVDIPLAAQIGSTDYGVSVTTASEVGLAVFGAPIADRTDSTLRIIASAEPDDGTVLEIIICELVS